MDVWLREYHLRAMSMVIGMAYCARGPYRHVRRLIERDPEAWFPWGYALSRVDDRDTLKPRAHLELWELDDLRAPRRASFLTGGIADYLRITSDFVEITVRANSGPALLTEDIVLSNARREKLVFAVMTAEGWGPPTSHVPALA